MTTVAVNPQSRSEEDDFEVIELAILVENKDFVGFFNQLEVWRATASESGPFLELTADKSRPARIPDSAGDEPATPVTGASANIVGLDLVLRVDEADEEDDVTVTFTGTDPLTFADAASQVTSQGLNKVRAYVDDDGTFVVTAVKPGTGSLLRIVEGEAAPLLGLPTTESDSFSFGREARLNLILDKQSYTFSDRKGSIEYFYKTRFRHKLSGNTSEFSEPFSAKAVLGVGQSNLALGQLDLVDGSGKPVSDRTVFIEVPFSGAVIDDTKVVANQKLSKKTDANGHVEFLLVRGMDITVAIAGTNLIKSLTVPTDSSIETFSLMDPSLSEDNDYFKVRVPDIPFAERRSL